MMPDNENEKPKSGPRLPGKKGGGNGDAKGTGSTPRHNQQRDRTIPSKATPQSRTKSRKITSSRA